MHVVEVRRDGDALCGPMAEMREWLDDKHIEPTLFRLSLIPGSTVFQLDFRSFDRSGGFCARVQRPHYRRSRSTRRLMVSLGVAGVNLRDRVAAIGEAG